MDELSNYLLSGKSHANISPEALELMGKKAATSYLADGVGLNDAIAKLAADYSNISPEQVKRVVEFANTAVYLAKHDQSKTAGADHSYPQFELADAGRIIQDLSDGARPTVMTQTDLDYTREAQKPKLASAPMDAALEDMFKTASAEDSDFSEETVAQQLLDTKEMLNNLRHNLQDRFNQNQSLFKEATAEFYVHSKQHMLEGGSLADIYSAAASTGTSENHVRQVMGAVVERLLSDKVASAKTLKADMSQLSKIAHRDVNPDHDLVKSFAAAMMASNEIQVLSNSIDEVNEESARVQDFIKNAYFSKEAFAGLVAGAGRMASSVMKGKNMLGSVARGAVKSLKSDPIGTIGTAKSLMPQKQPAAAPPTNTGY